MLTQRDKILLGATNVNAVWERAVKEVSPNPEGEVGKLIRIWADSINSEVVSYEKENNAALFLLDLSQLMLKGMSVNVIMVVPSPKDRDEEREIYFYLERYAEATKAAQSLCFLLFLQEQAPISKEFHPELLDLVVLDGSIIKKQLMSEKPEFLLFDTIVRQVRISRLCPFDTTRPAIGEMFMGRKDELRLMAQELDTSYIVTGARRVGKSSLVRRAVDNLEKKLEYRDRVFLFNCELWGRFESCARQIAGQIDIKEFFNIAKGPQNLLNLFKRHSKNGRYPLILFFDEFDRVIEIDKMNQWRLLKVIHHAVNTGWIRLVFSGYRYVSYIRDAKDSPFFQRIKLIRLPPLEDKDAIELFIKPFERIGIEVAESDQISQRIIKASGGFPYIIQFYGEYLFNVLAKKEQMSLSKRDMEQFEGSFEFGDFFERVFTENTQRNERLLALLYAYSTQDVNNSSWRSKDFLEEANGIGINLTFTEVSDACRNLVLANIFKYESDGYSFVFPVLKNQLLRQWSGLNLKELYERGGFGNDKISPNK
jgi:AAA+ ATPase superfamily predicted ATPase